MIGRDCGRERDYKKETEVERNYKRTERYTTRETEIDWVRETKID